MNKTSKNNKPIALIVGAGDYLGSAIAKRFSKGGFKIAASRRRGDLKNLIKSIEKSGGEAIGFHSDARSEKGVIELIRNIEGQLGPIEVCIYNVGGNVSYPILETTSRVYRKVWEMCALGGFLVSKEVLKYMLSRKYGTILFTGASASLRGKKGFSAFSGGKQALRALAQSLAREVGPEGIHISHVIIDGLIENENTRRLFPDDFLSRSADGILQPAEVAQIYWQLHQQAKNAWSFEVDLRPYSEPW